MDLVLNHSSDEHRWFTGGERRARTIRIMITMYGVTARKEIHPNDMRACIRRAGLGVGAGARVSIIFISFL